MVLERVEQRVDVGPAGPVAERTVVEGVVRELPGRARDEVAGRVEKAAARREAEDEVADTEHGLPVEAELLHRLARHLRHADADVDLVRRVDAHLVQELLRIGYEARGELTDVLALRGRVHR